MNSGARVNPAPSIVIIPTFNEAENIGSLLLQITRDMPSLHVLVVDDQSTDGTRSILERFTTQDSRIHLLTRNHKAGLAGAYIAGFDWAIDKGYAQCVQMNGDLTHDPLYLQPLLEGLNHHDVMVGCRTEKGHGSQHWNRGQIKAIQTGNYLARRLLQLPTRDLGSRFVAWKTATLVAIAYHQIRSRGYAFQAELKAKAHRAGFRVGEISVPFASRRFGQTKTPKTDFAQAAYRIIKLRYS